MHRQPVVLDHRITKKSDRFPVADYISARGLYLPTGLALLKDDVLKVCDKVRKIQRRNIR